MIAGFSWNLTCYGDSTEFSDLSTGPYPIISWSWDFGDSFTSTVQNPIHVFPDSNAYSVQLIITDSTGAMDTVIYMVDITNCPVTSFISPTDVERNIEIYPNPTSGILRVGMDSREIKKLEIFDVFGRLVLSESHSSSLDLSKLTTGIYYLKIEMNSGVRTMSQIIKM